MSLAGFLALVIIGQFLYPRDRVLPNAQLQGVKVGWQPIYAASAQTAETFNNSEVKFIFAGTSETVKSDELGIDVVTFHAAQKAAQYPLWQRFIPFSIFQPKHTTIIRTIDDERLAYYAAQLAKRYSSPMVNAGVKIVGKNVQLIPAQPSRLYTAQDIIEAVERAPASAHTSLTIAAQTTDPIRNDQAVKDILTHAKRIIDHPPTLHIAGIAIAVTPEQAAGWLRFVEDPTAKTLQVDVDSGAIHEFVQELQKNVYKAPGTSTVTLLDGKEVSRTTASSGQGLDTDTVTAAIRTGLLSTTQSINVPVVALPPVITYQRQYTKGSAGLAALLADIAPRGTSIAVIELGDGGRSAQSDGGSRFVAASTYKLFVAYAVIKRVEAGAITWDTPVNGNTVGGCFESMIVRSDNPCAKALGTMIGWGTIQSMMRGLGLGSTSLSDSGFYTTANDLALFLRLLQNGSLLSAGGSSRLLDAMHRQIYRAGIPAGTGVGVADKVGFVDGYMHDAAIVYGPNGPYILVIMTNGGSWSSIASMSRQIHNYLK